MSRVSLIAAAITWTGPIAVMLASVAIAQGSGPPDAGRIGAPVVHENLGVYFIRGTSAAGPVPLTLSEALGRGGFTVHETGSVNQLTVENTGSESVFIQAGDIVKGGQQDRVLTVSLLIPPQSGRMPIGAFCVEQGRWSVRGKEDVKRFASAEKSVPSREARLAMLAPVKSRPAQPAATAGAGVPPNVQTMLRQERTAAQTETSSRQAEVWATVGRIQSKLASNLQAPVASGLSASSLQLSLENDKLAAARAAYVKALLGAADGGGDIVGVVLAINGRLSSAEIYPSHGLFAKMWPKLLDAGATEAIADKAAKVEAMPSIAQVAAFLEGADAADAVEDTKLGVGHARELRESAASLTVATKRSDGGLVHKSYLAK